MNQSQIDLIDGVNRLVNKVIDYKSDDHRDEWQSPSVTAERGTGDCDDIALLKMGILKALFPPEAIQVLYVTTAQNEAHMVLRVNDLILDNRCDDLKTLKYSGPIYSIDAYGRVYDHEGTLSTAKVAKFEKAMQWD